MGSTPSKDGMTKDGSKDGGKTMTGTKTQYCILSKAVHTDSACTSAVQWT